MKPLRISVVIPVLNEGPRIRTCLFQFENQEKPFEVIVVDGGSRDGTREKVSEFENVRLLESEPGRGRQLNAGVAVASGDVFLFLHADTALPAGGLEKLRRALRYPDVAGGSFRLRHDGSNLLYRMLFPLIMWRSLLPAALPYGDQAIFCRSEAYFGGGGFMPIPIMEDYEFSRCLKRQGRLVRLEEYVTGSFRRFEGGTIRYFLICNLTFLLYRVGVPVSLLDRIYNGRN